MESDYLFALLEIFILIFVAEIVRSYMGRYGLPLIIGEIITGIILSPYGFGEVFNRILNMPLFTVNDYLSFLAEFSMILLIYSSGLEHGMSTLKSSGIYGILGALFGALVPFLVALALLPYPQSLILAVSVGATSIAAVSSILKERNVEGSISNFITVASAVDDVVDLLLLTVALSLISGEKPSFLSVAKTIVFYMVIGALAFALAVVILPKLADRIGENYVEEFPFISLFGLVFILNTVGFSPVVPAFLAGIALAESKKREEFLRISESLLAIFGSLFFVTVGFQLNIQNITFNGMILGLELFVIAMVFKIVGVFPFAYLQTKSSRSAFLISIGMTPRGETGIVVGSLGLTYNVLNTDGYFAVILMTLLTTLFGALLFSHFSKEVK